MHPKTSPLMSSGWQHGRDCLAFSPTGGSSLPLAIFPTLVATGHIKSCYQTPSQLKDELLVRLLVGRYTVLLPRSERSLLDSPAAALSLTGLPAKATTRKIPW